jgi:hypothetical protein
LQLLDTTINQNDFSRPFFRQLFAETIFFFRRENSKQVVAKLCSMATKIHRYLDYHLDDSNQRFVMTGGRSSV